MLNLSWWHENEHAVSHRAPEIPEELVLLMLRLFVPKKNKNKMAGWFIAWCAVPVNCHPPTVNLYRKREPEHRNESDEKSWVAACFCITLTHWQVVCWNMVNPLFLPSPGPAVGSCDSCFFLFHLQRLQPPSCCSYRASVQLWGHLSSSFSYLVTSLFQLRPRDCSAWFQSCKDEKKPKFEIFVF